MNNSSSSIKTLLKPIPSFDSSTRVGDLADEFRKETHAALLSLPIVDEGEIVGCITRYKMNEIFMSHYGRELYAKRPVKDFMLTTPLIVDSDQSIEQASTYITENITFPITEDFIVADNDQYIGGGVVLDVLKSMEVIVTKNAQKLESAYDELKNSQMKLVQSEKMASLGQMVAGVAHEINTPLGYVKNNVIMTRDIMNQTDELVKTTDEFVRLMVDGNPSEEQFTSFLSNLHQQIQEFREDNLIEETKNLINDSLYGVNQISELVLDLKNFSRLDQSMDDEYNLNECVRSALNIAKNQIKDRLEVILKLEDIPSVQCAPSQINQVILNLVTNASQAVSEEGGKILIRSFEDNNNVYISVQDNGKGIPAENLSKIFDPFFTTKKIGEGTGLGLSISFQIIESHGGLLRVKSEVGKGTRFQFNIPKINIAMEKAS